MPAADARPVPRKNTAWRVYFSLRKSDGTLVTSWTGADSEESLDGGSFTDCTNEATEIGTSGCGYLDLTAAEMNADAVMIKITVTNADALPLVMTVFPEEAGDYRADVTHFGGNAGTFSGGRPEVNTTHWAGNAVGSVTINCNMTQISGDTVAADNAEAFFDGTGYAGTNNVIPTVTIVNGIATVVIDAIVDAVWDEILNGSTHNIAGSAGRRLRQLASVIVHAGTAQGAGTGNNQIQLDTGASSTNGVYDPSLVFIEAGTGAGQCRLILQYNGSTRTATVDRDWRVNPDNTSEFVIIGDAGRESVNEGLAQAGTATTITLNTNASASDDAYNGQFVFIRSGTGQDQVALIEDYVGSTKVATIRTRAASGQWATTPDTTSAYMIVPSLTWTINEIQAGLATATELAKVPKSGETRRYTQVAANSGNKTADVSIGTPL